jgi:ACS family glucarate transporter-like MFS transporter
VFASTVAPQPVLKAVLLAFALGAADFALGACWAVCLDVGAEHAGVITGFMNTFGNLGGLVGPLVFGIAVDRWGSWAWPFYITALVYLAGAAAWLAIDPHHKLVAHHALAPREDLPGNSRVTST